MPRRTLIPVLIAAAGLVAGMFFVFRPAEETEPAVVVETLRITVRDGAPVGGVQRLTVTKGDQVRIVVDSDVDDEAHVHGYDVSSEVGGGGTAALAFEATLTGRFEIELEDRHLLIAELEVRP